jgi:hypothetical protein
LEKNYKKAVKDLRKKLRGDIADAVEKIGVDPETLGLERPPEPPPEVDPNDQHLEEHQVDDLMVLVEVEYPALQLENNQEMNYVLTKEEAAEREIAEKYNAAHPAQELEFSDDCIIINEAKDPGGVQAVVNTHREADDRVEALTYQTEKEREENQKKERKRNERGMNQELDLNEPDGAEKIVEQTHGHRDSPYVTVRINNFPSMEALRDKLSMVWEDYNMRSVVRMAVAFGVVLETVHAVKPPTHEARPAQLTDAYRYGVEVPVSSTDDNKLFVDNVIARLAALKELAQKDTKTKVICVYQILIASYHPPGAESLTKYKRHGRTRSALGIKDAQSVQNKGEAKDGSAESGDEDSDEDRDGGGLPG